MSSEQQGGKRRVPKKEAKAPERKPSSSTRTVSSKSSASKAATPKRVPKKGGAIVEDVKTLAVPFAVLLAKEGLSKVFNKKDTKPSPSLSAKTAAKPSSMRRRSTLSGGSCNLGCGAMTGGQAAKALFALQNDIDHFLEKY